MRAPGSAVVRHALAGVVLATLALTGRVGAAPPPTDPPTSPNGPVIEVVDSSVTGDTALPGQTFKVEGRGWPANTLVQLEVCGAEARSGSSDCAVDSAQVVATVALAGILALARNRVPD